MICISRGKGMIYNCKFAKANILRKGRPGAESQEQACLMFSQAEGNVNSTWSLCSPPSHHAKTRSILFDPKGYIRNDFSVIQNLY